MQIKRLAAVAREFKLVNADSGVFEGYASIFGVVDHDSEMVMTGAFAASLSDWKSRGSSPALLWQHDPTNPVGVWTDLAEDNIGLKATGKLVTSSRQGADAYELLKAGAVTGMSIGYRTRADAIVGNVRQLKEIQLFEISLVTFPCCEPARVDTVKSSPPQTIREFEALLRDAGGYSKSHAAAIAARGFKAASDHRDDDDATQQLLASIARASAAITPTSKRIS